MTASCVSCQKRTDHCHGTLVVHAWYGVDCTDVGCVGFELTRHDLVVLCTDVDGGCGSCAERARAGAHAVARFAA